MRCGAGLATHSLYTVREACAKLVGSARNCLVATNLAPLEKQLFNVTQLQLKPEMPTHRATGDMREKTVTLVQRFQFRHHGILRERISNVTELVLSNEV